MIVLAFVKPLGHVASAAVGENYISSPFFKGFTEGYNTLDALASLAFGIVVVSTLRNMGVEKPGDIAKGMIKSGAFSVVLMGIIYTLLAYMGTMSIGAFPISENGGIALAQIANYYLGLPGSILLAFIVVLACLKTGIGLSTAFSETFEEMFPKVSYQNSWQLLLFYQLFCKCRLNQHHSICRSSLDVPLSIGDYFNAFGNHQSYFQTSTGSLSSNDLYHIDCCCFRCIK